MCLSLSRILGLEREDSVAVYQEYGVSVSI
jgi:hypothetical protein